jgi:hypothetical protein
VMFSSDTVHDVNENFPLRSHACPPSYELSAYTVTPRGSASFLFYIFLRGSQTEESRGLESDFSPTYMRMSGACPARFRTHVPRLAPA